jgi:hypothetical protein
MAHQSPSKLRSDSPVHGAQSRPGRRTHLFHLGSEPPILLLHAAKGGEDGAGGGRAGRGCERAEAYKSASGMYRVRAQGARTCGDTSACLRPFAAAQTRARPETHRAGGSCRRSGFRSWLSPLSGSRACPPATRAVRAHPGPPLANGLGK